MTLLGHGSRSFRVSSGAPSSRVARKAGMTLFYVLQAVAGLIWVLVMPVLGLFYTIELLR